MQTRIRGIAAVGTCVAVGACAWAFSGAGWVAAAALALALLALVLGAALVRERRASAGLERALGLETARARQFSDQAWQSALLTQIIDELRISLDESEVLDTSVAALTRTLEASRALVYQDAGDGVWRITAQYAAEGVSRVDDGAVLPPVLAWDRVLAERLSESELTEASDPELRALGERLRARSIAIFPVGETRVLAVHRCDAPRPWTSSERRFIQRFADQLDATLARAAEYRRQTQDNEVWAGLLRVAHALSAARESNAVLDIVMSAGVPLARCRASAILVDGGGSSFEILTQQGFEPELSPASVRSLEGELEDCFRARSTVRVFPRDFAARGGSLASVGALAIVPLYYGREALGVLVLEKALADAVDQTWTDRDIDIAQSLAELTASAWKNARLFETLSSAEARYADLRDLGLDLYQTVEPGGRILDCNETECRVLGYSKENLVGRRFDWLLTQESAATWRRLGPELFSRGSMRESELELLTRDGQSVDVIVNGMVLPAGEDGPTRAQLIMRDVSEQRGLEQQLRQRQKLEIVGALAGGVAHDFNNVLGGILGYASLLRADLRDRPGARRFADTIERSAVRGAELSQRLLAASRKSPARREAVNVNDVVDETLELLAHTFHKNVRIKRRLDARVRSILADAGQLQQVVLNLCVNARDAMPEGGTLRVTTEVDESADQLRLSVEDTGVGMEPTTMQRVFEPFFSTKGEGGSGLGLSVVAGIVKSLDGEVRVKSSPGRGARFDIFVPAEWVEASVRPSHAVDAPRGRGELVLLVDDERVLRELGKEILECHGYQVEAVASGEEALAFIRESGNAVSLVILDLIMPGIDGGETYRRLRDVNTTVPVLLSSGLSSEGAVEQILAEGASGFIPKPYGIGELTEAVSLAIHRGDERMLH